MQKIIPNLWFDKNAEEAVAFYSNIFNNTRTLHTSYYSEAGHEIHGMEAGTVLTIDFELEGYRFVALNGGPHFTFTPAISFMVSCPTVDEVDALWERLSDGGSPLMPLDTYPFSDRYGWIQDKYGLSWQIAHNPEVPVRSIMPAMLFVGKQCGRAEEAMRFYTEVFENAKMGTLVHYGSDQPGAKEGTVMYGDFTLEGQIFSAMDSALQHEFTFTPAISYMVSCKDQAEIDRLWGALSAVPEAEQCGWLVDQFGVSWQIVAEDMNTMLLDPDKEKVDRMMNAMLQMKKIDIDALRAAFEGTN